MATGYCGPLFAGHSFACHGPYTIIPYFVSPFAGPFATEVKVESEHVTQKYNNSNHALHTYIYIL